MPQILVVTDDHDQHDRTVVYRERLAPSDFDSAHFSGQLAERVGWAVDDARQIERRQPPELAGVGANMAPDERAGQEALAS